MAAFQREGLHPGCGFPGRANSRWHDSYGSASTALKRLGKLGACHFQSVLRTAWAAFSIMARCRAQSASSSADEGVSSGPECPVELLAEDVGVTEMTVRLGQYVDHDVEQFHIWTRPLRDVAPGVDRQRLDSRICVLARSLVPADDVRT